jgi:hypothetical protein
MKGIVITTSEATKVFLPELLKSIEDKYSILVVGNQTSGEHIDITNEWNGFELGGIGRGYENFDEFVHLMDTCVIKDNKMFDIMFEHKGSMYLCDYFFSYLGKYRKEILDLVGVPKINNKRDAIALENRWNGEYLRNDPDAKQFIQSLPIHTDKFIEKNGRTNMVLENDYIIKYKATWGK